MVTELSYYLWRCPKRISDSFEDAVFSPGEYLLERGKTARWLHLLLEGEAQGGWNGDFCTQVRTYHKNEILGLLEFSPERVWGYSIRAEQRCITKRVEWNCFCDWMEADRMFYHYVHQEFGCKLATAKGIDRENNYKNLLLQAKGILCHMARKGEESMALEKFAQMMGVDEVTARCITADLARDGVVCFSGETVKIINPDALWGEMSQYHADMMKKRIETIT